MATFVVVKKVSKTGHHPVYQFTQILNLGSSLIWKVFSFKTYHLILDTAPDFNEYF